MHILKCKHYSYEILVNFKNSQVVCKIMLLFNVDIKTVRYCIQVILSDAAYETIIL